MASTGSPAPKARPWATEQAVRKPVKAPGPRPKATASRSRSASARALEQREDQGQQAHDASGAAGLIGKPLLRRQPPLPP